MPNPDIAAPAGGSQLGAPELRWQEAAQIPWIKPTGRDCGYCTRPTGWPSRSVRCEGPPIRPLGWSKPAKSGLGALPRTPRLHERRQPGALSWVQSGVLWAPVWHQTGGAWPQGTPRAGGLRRGPGGAALCLTSADIDPRAPISSPMGGARGLLRNPKVAMFRSVPGGSMDLWARPYVEKRGAFQVDVGQL